MHTDYRRHNTDIPATATAILSDIEARYGETDITLALTGSVGMGYAESLHCTFVQEVICAAEVIKARYPQVKTLIDIGGEDSKMIFFEEGRVPDIRMNGNCAGGTGAFIDQTATLIGANPADIGTLAKKATSLHPIASRCGVFAKTDIQNLLSRDVSRSDIAASVLDSVSRQVITSLARGTTIRPAVFMCGGPFAFIPQLRESMRKVLGLKDEDCIVPDHAQFIPAWGAALYARRKGGSTVSLSSLKDFFSDFRERAAAPTGRLEPLFSSPEDYRTWFEGENIMRTGKAVLDTTRPGQYWLGVDSGSTTTKAVLLDGQGRIVYTDYLPNDGDSLGTFGKIIKRLTDQSRNPDNVRIVSSCVTGYGEDLLRGTFGLEQGIVETMAHYTAAREVSPQVSFVLDIGGQDMKAIFCGNGSISRMELNEACSSGCGSFLENFAASLGYNIGQFADMACFAPHPCDLGSRCTVFMNSKVKQAMREGATTEDIAAGFSYSVVRNCLFKVLKLKNLSELGEHVVVQGGTFRNHSIIRALEKTLGLRVSFSDIPELMGAYGCALHAMRTVPATAKDGRSLTELALDSKYSARTIICSGCTNHCKVKEMTFRNGNVYYSGNNCEKVFHNGDRKAARKGVNMLRERYHLLFDRASGTDGKSLGKVRIGIPRGLGIYEDFPFWHTLLTECGMQPVLSSPSSTHLYTSGIRYTMSDNICFPAKLIHGHVMDLLQKKVDRILYPYVVYERKDDAEAGNSYNCPIVSGYSDVLKSSMNEALGQNTPFDSPVISFADPELARTSCVEYLETLGVDRKSASKAFDKAMKVQSEFSATLTARAEEVLRKAIEEKRMVILLACRPYHADPMIEHDVSEAIADMGIDVITENVATSAGKGVYGQINAVSQWAWPNRIFKSAWFVGEHPYPGLHYVQLTSFGCGPDAFILDEAASILRRHGKNLTALKIDDVNNIGSLKLRIRSLVESVSNIPTTCDKHRFTRATTKPFEAEDRNRTIIVPYFAEGYSEFIPPVIQAMGYKAISLEPGCQADVDNGLRYANNDICYPATIVVGSIMNYLHHCGLPHDQLAVVMYQTGGQCRATNYFALIQNAMIADGFADVPVISISPSANIHANQPGFTIDWKHNAKLIVHTVLYADCLSKMYHSAIAREKHEGDADRLRKKYTTLAQPAILSRDCAALRSLITDAAREFASAIRTDVHPPVIGVVGEIYVKYNSFSNKNVIHWLNSHGIETVSPTICGFFTTAFANRHINRRLHICNYDTPAWVSDMLYRWIRHYAKAFDKACSPYPLYHPFTDIFDDARAASRIVNLAGDFGEGWYLPAEISNLATMGVRNVVSLQPFGCIANHIISKGIEKRIKQLYPQMSLLFLDFDSNTSEANVYNRLHFMIENAIQ